MEWAELFGDEVQAVAILDRLLHDAEILTINGPSWRLRGRGDLLRQTPETAKNGKNSPTDTPSATPARAAEGRRRARLILDRALSAAERSWSGRCAAANVAPCKPTKPLQLACSSSTR